jgi:O-antigen ligase
VAGLVAGMFLVPGYLGFGLAEVIFWSVKGSLFYALMAFLLMGFCLNAKEKIG